MLHSFTLRQQLQTARQGQWLGVCVCVWCVWCVCVGCVTADCNLVLELRGHPQHSSSASKVLDKFYMTCLEEVAAVWCLWPSGLCGGLTTKKHWVQILVWQSMKIPNPIPSFV